jgi:uncharacterized protein (TIGR03067 family)
MNARLSIVVVVALVVAQSVAADDPRGDVQVEMKKLEGTWRGVSFIADGKEVAGDRAKGLALTLKADGTWALLDGKDKSDGMFTVDPGKKPKAASFVIKNGMFKDMTTLDIYDLDGDTLKICYVMVPAGKESTKERPSKFAAEAGSGHILWVMKREKSK